LRGAVLGVSLGVGRLGVARLGVILLGSAALLSACAPAAGGTVDSGAGTPADSGGAPSPGEAIAEAGSPTPVVVSDACEAAFAEAGAPDNFTDTSPGLDAALSACRTVEEFEAANERFLTGRGGYALFVGDAVPFLRARCLQQSGDPSPLCKQVEAMAP
jgi:hypothetical protein